MSAPTGRQLVPRRPSVGRELLRGALTAKGRPGVAGRLPARSLRMPAVRIDPANLYAYQRLCGYPVNDRLPHPYPHLLGFPLQAQLMADKDFPLPLPGLVHVRNTSTLHRRLSAADRLDLTVWAERLAPHPRGSTVDLCATAELDGALVWESTSTYLHRGGSTRSRAASVADEPQPPGVPDRAVAARWRLPADLGRRYAALSGDVNPIHLHPLTARALGFPRAIAHGMWTFARTMAALGPRTLDPGTAKIWFRQPVLLPGSVAMVRADGAAGTRAGLLRPDLDRTVHLVLEFTRN